MSRRWIPITLASILGLLILILLAPPRLPPAAHHPW